VEGCEGEEVCEEAVDLALADEVVAGAGAVTGAGAEFALLATAGGAVAAAGLAAVLAAGAAHAAGLAPLAGAITNFAVELNVTLGTRAAIGSSFDG
jgi:hypothetical protein